MLKINTDPTKWLLSLPDEYRAEMVQLDALISTHLPEASRTMWEGVFWGGTDQMIIGYGDLVQQQSRGRVVEWFMVGLARQKDSFSLYINAVQDGQYLIKTYGKRIGKAKTGASSVSFRKLDDLDLTVLGEMLAIINTQLNAVEINSKSPIIS